MGVKEPRKVRIADKTVLKTLAQCSFAQGGEIASVDVKDGKIVRIRPHHHTERYTEEELGQYELNKDGVKYKTPLKGLLAPLPYRLQEAGLFPEPHQVPAQTGGLGPQRRPGLHRSGGRNTAEPGQEQVRADQLGRGDHPHRRRDRADPQGIRPTRRLRPRRRPRRDQDGSWRSRAS